jgi:hypothetical protein
MRSQFETEPKVSGTTIGATLSLFLIVLFGLSSIAAEQKDMQANAGQPTTDTVSVRAYLA